MHIDEFLSNHPAHSRAKARIEAAEAIGAGEGRDAIARALRSATRRGDELARTCLLYLRARNLSMHADKRAAGQYDAVIEHCQQTGNHFWHAIALVQRSAALKRESRALSDLWKGVQLLESIEGSGIHLLRARLELIGHVVSFDSKFASELFDKTSIDIESLGSFECNQLGYVCRELGRLGDALAWYRHSLAVSESQHSMRIPFALLGAGILHSDFGDFESAITCLTEALEHHGTYLHRPRATIELGLALSAAGRSAEGELLLREYIECPAHESHITARRAASSALAGLVAGRDPDEAIALLEVAVALADLDKDDAAALADRRTLIALLESCGHHEKYHRRILEYVSLLEQANARSLVVADQRKSLALELHSMTSRLQVHELESRLQAYTREYTTQELARQAALTAAFSDRLQSLTDSLLAVLDGNDGIDSKLRSIRRIIDKQSGHEVSLQSLEIAFATINPSFTPTLAARYSGLTREETRVCMLLRMRLCSADIARYLNRSPRSIENHRFRIRRKLALDSSDSLTEALVAIG